MIAALLWLVLAPLAVGEDGADTWPDYRGPTRDGHAPAGADPPVEWSEEQHVSWKVPIRGRGWSTPVVLDGVAWLTSATEDGREQYAIAVDVAQGEVLRDELVWSNAQPYPCNSLNSHASPSAVVEDGRVYLHYGAYGTVCLDTETGERRWERRDLVCDHMEGPGSSPLLWEDLLILHVDGGDVQYVVALRKETGETAWRTQRSVDLSDLPDDLRKAYSTPIVVAVDGEPELVSSAAQATFGYDPRSGKELWRLRHGGFSMSSRPVHADGVVYLNTGFMQPELWALRLGGEGVLDDERVLWRVRRGLPTMPSPVLAGGHLFVVSDGGIASCLDAGTGEQVWRQRLGGEFSASPVLAAGRLYFCDRSGRTSVVAATPEYQRLAVNQLDAGCMASPVVLGDALLLRTKTHLYRVER